jgi:catechol 2,3-dioxygenase-like lactoylglutathione lyase family enzyme
LTSVTIGSPNPSGLAGFYSRLLDRPVTTDDPPIPGDPDKGGWAQMLQPGDITLNFEFERHFTAPVWPSAPGQQIADQHLDIHVDDLAESVAWALQHGARLADHQPQAGVRVLFDPDGHPFCLYR